MMCPVWRELNELLELHPVRKISIVLVFAVWQTVDFEYHGEKLIS